MKIFCKNLMKVALMLAASSSNVLLAVNNSYGPDGTTTPGLANGALAGSQFTASTVVGSTNSLTVGNDIAWTGLIQGTLSSDADSSTTQLTSVVSGSSLTGQTVYIVGQTNSDFSFTQSGDSFMLHGSGSNTIPFVIISDKAADGSGGETIFTPNKPLINQSAVADDTAQRTLKGRISSGTTLVADSYTCSIVVKNYLNN